MANHKSAIKRYRQSLKRRDRNRVAKSALRTAIKKARAAIASGDKKLAMEQYVVAQRTIAKASNKKLIHAANASRNISRLASALASIQKA